MPLPAPVLDPRRYQNLLDEALARIPVHTPEWTNFNASDPGVTLAALFAFLTENSLHLLNRAPDNLTRRFLESLQLRLQPGAPAQALVQFANDRGAREDITLDTELEVRAGQVPFRTRQGLDVLPVEAQAYVKRPLAAADPQLTAYYASLYKSFLASDAPTGLTLYETIPLPPPLGAGIDLGSQDESVDRSLWIALLVPIAIKPLADGFTVIRRQLREAMAGKTLSLALVPVVDAAQGKVLPAGGAAASGAIAPADAQLIVRVPQVDEDGGVAADREPQYRTLLQAPVPTIPTVLQIPLPAADGLEIWNNLDPLEPGADEFPPTLDDTASADRLVTWLRVTWPEGAAGRILWTGINTVEVVQRTRIVAEMLPRGNGRPDQVARLAHRPVLPGTVKLTVEGGNGVMQAWQEIDDLLSAGPEVSAPDPRHPPGVLWEAPMSAEVFALDAEQGLLRFGDGLRGKRPPTDAGMEVGYDYSSGTAGNVRTDAIKQSPSLPPGITVRNPLPTWGGADAETPEEGRKQVARWLQHRDRLVNDEDFRTIPRRAPGLEIGRVEVLPLYDPRLGEQTEPGAAPGVVTLLVVPTNDPVHPDTPEPDAPFLQALCRYLEPRRLITTEVVLRGPIYLPIWISVGIGVAATQSIAVAREAVEIALREFLSPLPPVDTGVAELAPLLTAPDLNAVPGANGWQWRKAVTRGELLAAVARVPGIVSVLGVQLGANNGPNTENVPMGPLNFPRLAGLSVVVGSPLDLDQMRGTSTPATRQPPQRVAVPVIPKEC